MRGEKERKWNETIISVQNNVLFCRQTFSRKEIYKEIFFNKIKVLLFHTAIINFFSSFCVNMIFSSTFVTNTKSILLPGWE